MKYEEHMPLSNFGIFCIDCKGHRFFDTHTNKYRYKYELYNMGYKSFEEIKASTRFRIERMPKQIFD